ncbi:MAG: family 43 glycosylhydrolase [Tannerellaceae bacterium]|nr:family 43 glycosylhydrolase [Tannerellaceae bacterium]
MKTYLYFTLFLAFICLPGTTTYAQHTGLYRNPVIPGEFADPTIIQIGDCWYAAGTSSEWAPFYPLYKSDDLVNWIQIGHLFEEQPEWTTASFWAPELFFYNDKIYVYYTARNKAGISYIGVAIAEDTRFQFTDYGPVIEWGGEAIDAFVLEDEGDLYISWKAYGLDDRLIELLGCKLSADGLRMEGEPFSLLRDDEHMGMEGQHWFKKNGFYYMIYSVKGCCGPESDYEVYVARSKSLKGPYEKYSGNPILKGDGKDVLSCGHGTFTELPDGRMFYLFHAYLTGTGFYGGRQGMLQELVIREGWPAFVAGNQTQLIQETPFSGTVQKSISSFRDDFTDLSLSAAWTWNYPYMQIDVKTNAGKLYLSGKPVTHRNTGTVLCLRPLLPDYSYMTQIQAGESTSFQGLTFYGDADNLLLWGSYANKLALKEVRDGHEVILYEDNLTSDNLYLKIEIKNGTYASFFRSMDGQEWVQILSGENEMNLSPLVRWDRAARPGLIHQGNPEEPAIFDFFELKYKGEY